MLLGGEGAQVNAYTNGMGVAMAFSQPRHNPEWTGRALECRLNQGGKWLPASPWNLMDLDEGDFAGLPDEEPEGK